MNWINNHMAPLALLLCLGLSAQHNGSRERIKTLKVGYITEQLNLSAEEAQAFWPVYNAHEEKMETFRRKERTLFKEKLSTLDELTESEAAQLLSKLQSMKMEKQKLESAYISELQKIIPPKKIIRLLQAEEGFKRKLLHHYGRKRRGRP
ncbi:MAG: hypothetical protein AB3N16_15640 [Flavobacteriaceae bacterium]